MHRLEILGLLFLSAVIRGQLLLDPGTNVYSEKTDLFDLQQEEKRNIAVAHQSFFNILLPDHPYKNYDWTSKGQRELKLLQQVGQGHNYPSGPGKPSKRSYAFQAIGKGNEDLMFINTLNGTLETARRYIITVTIH